MVIPIDFHRYRFLALCVKLGHFELVDCSYPSLVSRRYVQLLNPVVLLICLFVKNL